MSTSPSDSLHHHLIPEIPIEIVSNEEMALLEAALVSARSLFSPPRPFPSNVRSIHSITLLSKRTLSGCPEPDIEDSGLFKTTQKKTRLDESFLHRFRRKKGIFVTDFTSSEWCEKQMEFVLLHGKRKVSEAMKNGSQRHAILEEEFAEFFWRSSAHADRDIAEHTLGSEVVTRVKVDVDSDEDKWALKLLNSITCINQLLFEGLTRELRLIGFAERVWMVGVIDEVQMPATETYRNPLLVDTKTRVKDTLPYEAQRRNGRLQLMCYKYIWDNLVSSEFPSNQFFDYFSLNPDGELSKEIRDFSAELGVPAAKTLADVLRCYINTWSMLPPAHDQLLLRYELQTDHSLIGEDDFAYDSEWVKKQIQVSLEFWLGEREANYTSEEERWKCNFCQFASTCPAKGVSCSNLPT